MERLFFILTGFNGLLAVALGAFGAHGLETRFAAFDDAAQRMDWWQTAAHYHLIHALALAVAGYLVGKGAGDAAQVAGFAFLGGILIFSGSLYAMALTGTRALGAVTPVGGLCLLVGWAAVIGAAWQLPS